MGNEKFKGKQTMPMLRRLSVIHSMIKEMDYPSCTDFMKANETSIATTNRDMNTLRYTFNAPVEYDSSKKGYYYSEEFELPFRNSCEMDYEILMSAKMLLSRYENTPLYDNLSKTLLFMVQSDDEETARKILERFTLAPRQKIKIHSDIWQLLTQALRENRIVEFDYNGRWNTELTHRRIRPYQLVFDEGYVFLYGYSEERAAERLFLLQRIQKLILTDDTFELPVNFKFEETCSGSRFGAYSSQHKEDFEIEFYNDSRTYIRDAEWAENQVIEEDEEKGCTILKFTSGQFHRILTWILSHGGNVRPIKPARLVTEWKKEIKLMEEMSKE